MAPHNDDHNINAANMIFWHCMKKTNPLTHKRNQNGSIKFGGNTNTSTLEQFCQDVKRIPTSLTINTWRWANKSNPETARQQIYCRVWGNGHRMGLNSRQNVRWFQPANLRHFSWNWIPVRSGHNSWTSNFIYKSVSTSAPCTMTTLIREQSPWL